jgi:hypothetical protein
VGATLHLVEAAMPDRAEGFTVYARRVLAVGDRIPDVCVWLGTHEPVSLRELAAGGPTVLFFYLFDWSST